MQLTHITFAHVRKFVTALLGATAIAVSEGLVPEEVGSWLSVAIGFATALGVYQVGNQTESPTEDYPVEG